jgi:ATP-binding cassette subfamily B protein
MGGVMVISLLATALNLAQPWLSKLMIDGALLHRDVGKLWQVAGLMVVATLGGYALNMLASWRHVALSAAMLFDIRLALLAHLQTLSPRFFSQFRLGDLMSRINSDVSDVQRVAGDTLLAALSNLLFLLGTLGMMVWLDWRLCLVGIALVPVATLGFLRAQKMLVDLTRQMREAGADIGSLLVDTITGMRLVVAMNAQRRELDRFARANAVFVRHMLRLQATSFASGALPGSLLTFSTVAVVVLGGMRIVHGQTSIGTLVAFLTYQQRLFSPVQGLMGLSSTLSSTRVALARIFDLMDTPAEIHECAHPLPVTHVAQALAFHDVHLSHGRDPVLAGASFAIPAGSFCAILGASGAGKSSLADALIRLVDPDAGRITLDEVDLRDLDLAGLRRTIVLVEQTPFLMNATLRDNILFGAEPVEEADLTQAIAAAGLTELLARLPQGLATRTGERGQALSAGERQRVALARALLRRPEVLILDEPTAALDGATEALVAANLRAFLPRATLIVITHKPALAAQADLLLRLDNGLIHTQSRCLVDA